MLDVLARTLRDPHRRRAVTVPAVGWGATVLSATAGLWGPVALTADVLCSPGRLPRTRTLAFATAWTGLETFGVAASTALWAAGRSDDREVHYALQRWWAARFVDALRVTCGLRFEVEGEQLLAPGPVVMCVRHASIADALLPAWLLGRNGMRPRYVLKEELRADPCLDIVGGRVPNHFVDRDPEDSASELALVETMATGMGARDAAVIFPEGTVASDERRRRAVERLVTRDPERAKRVSSLQHVLPVRPGGTRALLAGAPDADVVFVAHRGFEALDPIGAAPGRVPLRDAVRVRVTRVQRVAVPEGDGFGPWLDARWAEIDRWIARVDDR